jgi:hypothetical protein
VPETSTDVLPGPGETGAAFRRLAVACQAAPGADANEDHAVTTPHLVVVLDGITVPAGLATGCRHGTPWFVQRLAGHLVAASALAPSAPLARLLSEAIARTAADHADTCDLSHPGTPASTVALLRAGADTIDHLVLSDSPVVLDLGSRVDVVHDHRVTRTSLSERAAVLAGGGDLDSPAHVSRVATLVSAQRRYRNRPGGHWVASACPEAADHAVTGSTPRSSVRRAAVLTDGATRLVDLFGLTDWTGLLDLLAVAGPDAVVERVRTAERDDPDGVRHPRAKRHDDATAVYCEP